MARRSVLTVSVVLALGAVFFGSFAYPDPDQPKYPKHPPMCLPGEIPPTKPKPKAPPQNHLCGSGTNFDDTTRVCACKPDYVESGQDVLGRLECKPEVDFGPYLKELQTSIRQNWTPPTRFPSNTMLKTIMMFKLSKDGTLGGVCLQQSSGSSRYDDQTYQAILKSAPFSPLPQGVKTPDVDVQFIFDYEQHQHRAKPFLIQLRIRI